VSQRMAFAGAGGNSFRLKEMGTLGGDDGVSSIRKKTVELCLWEMVWSLLPLSWLS
jgi:hypothetical protein